MKQDKDIQKIMDTLKKTGLVFNDEQKNIIEKHLQKKKKQEKTKNIPEDVKVALTDTNNLFQDYGNEQNSDVEDIKQIIETWLSDAFLHSKTRLTPNQVIALTILKTLSEIFNIECIQKLIDNYVRYKLSENGKSSQELVDILKARSQPEMDDNLSKSLEPFLR